MAGQGDTEVRIILVGKTGNGKSATANTILGRRQFDSKICANAVTKTCQRAYREWKGKNLVVVDTPGLFDTKETMKTTCFEISRCVLYSCPGPHAIILVLRLDRYTEEEQKTVALIKGLFGEAALKYMIILFTHKEDLEDQSLDNFNIRGHNRKNVGKEDTVTVVSRTSRLPPDLQSDPRLFPHPLKPPLAYAHIATPE